MVDDLCDEAHFGASALVRVSSTPGGAGIRRHPGRAARDGGPAANGTFVNIAVYRLGHAGQEAQSAGSSAASRAGSARMSISTIRPPARVKASSATGCPATTLSTPAAPLTNTGNRC